MNKRDLESICWVVGCVLLVLIVLAFLLLLGVWILTEPTPQ